MTYQRRFGWSNRNIIFRNLHAPFTCIYYLNKSVQKTHRRRSLTNRHNIIRDDSCINNCEYFNRSRCADRGYCLYSGLGTATYSPQCCSYYARILHYTKWIVCRNDARTPANQCVSAYLIHTTFRATYMHRDSTNYCTSTSTTSTLKTRRTAYTM